MKAAQNRPDNTASRWTKIKLKLKKSLYFFIALAIIIIGVFIYWKYFYTYNEGYRSGVLQKFSHKGNFIKTFEGEIILRSLPAKMNVAVAPERFNFTVTIDNVADQLDSMQGQMIIVHYKEKNGSLFWRSNSNFLVDSVRLIP